jgi:kumamolisin
MKSRFLLMFLLLSCCVAFAQSQADRHAVVIVPDSSVSRPEDVGLRAHTNHLILVRPEFTGTAPRGETPASLACVYKTVSTQVTGCPISGTTALPNGGAGVIAIVDAFHFPTAENDLNVFSAQFGLPACTTQNGCFKQITLGTRASCGWGQEAALDIEWAHAMAPNAKIVLVEAATNSFADLFAAVDRATQEVTASSGHGEVSMSWGGSEFSSEAGNDGHFQNLGVAYFASSGDSGGVTIYPGASPYVISAGGTSVNRDRQHLFTAETGWSGSGGGPSKYESRPSYQDGISAIVGSKRGVPDFSFDADPNTGVSVYDSTRCQGLSGWLVFGGTSVSSPSLAGIVNLAAHFGTATSNDTSTEELSLIYGGLGSSNFFDVLSGNAGSFSATAGWDFVTGAGSNRGLNGK